MQNHTVNEQWDQDLAPCLLTKPLFFYIMIPCSFLSLFRDENNGSCLGRWRGQSRRCLRQGDCYLPKPLTADPSKLWQTLREMGVPDHWTCLLRKLYAGATVRTGHGATDWFQIGKGVRQGCILSPCLFNLYAEYIMRNAGLDEAQAGIKIAGRNINNLRYADDTTLMVESKEELKSPLMKVKEESEEVGLNLNIQKTKIMASGAITSSQIDGNSGNSDRLYFLGLQNHCRWWL